jgi:hypothetical protein
MITEFNVEDRHIDERFGHLRHSNYHYYLKRSLEGITGLNHVPIRREYHFRKEILPGDKIAVTNDIHQEDGARILTQMISVDGVNTTVINTVYARGAELPLGFEKLIDQAIVDMQLVAGVSDSFLRDRGLGLFVYGAIYEGHLAGATYVETELVPERTAPRMTHVIYSDDMPIGSAETKHIFVNLEARRFDRYEPMRKMKKVENIMPVKS